MYISVVYWCCSSWSGGVSAPSGRRARAPGQGRGGKDRLRDSRSWAASVSSLVRNRKLSWSEERCISKGKKIGVQNTEFKFLF